MGKGSRFERSFHTTWTPVMFLHRDHCHTLRIQLGAWTSGASLPTAGSTLTGQRNDRAAGFSV